MTGMQPFFEFDRLSDEQLKQLQTARRELGLADEAVKYLFEYRVFSGCLTYAEIGQILGATHSGTLGMI